MFFGKSRTRPKKFDSFPEKLSGGSASNVFAIAEPAMSPKVLLCDAHHFRTPIQNLVGEVLKVLEQISAKKA